MTKYRVNTPRPAAHIEHLFDREETPVRSSGFFYGKPLSDMSAIDGDFVYLVSAKHGRDLTSERPVYKTEEQWSVVLGVSFPRGGVSVYHGSTKLCFRSYSSRDETPMSDFCISVFDEALAVLAGTQR